MPGPDDDDIDELLRRWAEGLEDTAGSDATIFSDPRFDDLYDRTVGDSDSPEARELFQQGWGHENISPDERSDARDHFRDYLRDNGIEFDDVFDWDDWREFYDSAA